MANAEVGSSLVGILRRASALIVKSSELNCDEACALMSPFIDSMATPEEADRLQNHVSGCESCARQLQSYVSLRSLLARAEQTKVPEDLVLETRVRLSHARYENFVEQFKTRIANILKPIAIPALFGVSVTMLCFGVLLTSLVSNTTVLAQSRTTGDSAAASLFVPVRTTDPTMLRFAGSDNNNWDEPLMIETHVGEDGLVVDYHIISGPQNPAVDKWVSELLYFAKFTPAMAFGKPIESRIILSFVAVRS
jgi:hypothetical protein